MSESEASEVQVFERDGVTVVVPVGEFDVDNVATLREPVLGAVAAGRPVVLDMAGTTFIDSTVIATMTAGRVQACRKGLWLRIATPRSNILRVLQLMALDTVIGIFPTVDDALAPVADIGETG